MFQSSVTVFEEYIYVSLKPLLLACWPNVYKYINLIQN